MNINLERELRKHMTRHNLDPNPYEGIIADGERHEYEAYINGELKTAHYNAFLNPFDEEESLMCTYGLENDSKQQYTYLSHPQEPFKNIK